MKIESVGAVECVTGSCHIINVNGKNVMLDCGLYQGSDEKDKENLIFNFNPQDIDFVILSHSHIDHSGRIPLLYKKGFTGAVLCTNATKELCSVMLPDSGHIAEMEVEWKNRKRMRQGMDLIEPIYTAADASFCINYFKGCDYDEKIELFEGFKIVFRDSGHLLGAAITEMFIKEGEEREVKVVYTGDLGNINIPLLKDPTYIDSADYVIMESTYGNRLHEDARNQLGQLADIVKQTFKRGGNVVIPSFAVGRTQEVLYSLNKSIEGKLLENVVVFVDSPLASESTKIFEKYRNSFDEEAKTMINQGDDPLNFEGLVFTGSAEDSAKINRIKSGAIIISASGMCEAGRIKHHLKHNLWRKECSIVFVGYQAQGTLGRSIVDGAKKVKLFGEDVAVNAKIYNFHGLSGHADKNGLIKWVKSIKKKPKEILLVHGDKDAQSNLCKELREQGFNVSIMKAGHKYYINSNVEKANSFKENIIKYLNSIEIDENTNKEEIMENIKKIMLLN